MAVSEDLGRPRSPSSRTIWISSEVRSGVEAELRIGGLRDKAAGEFIGQPTELGSSAKLSSATS